MPVTTQDPYELLGVPRSASADEIKAAYRKLAKQIHPDLNPGNETIANRFKDVSSAYDLLSDPKKRQRFDRGEIDGSGAERPSSRFHRGFSERSARGGAAGFNGLDPEDIFDMFRQRGTTNAGTSSSGTGSRRRGADLSYSVTVDFLAATLGSRRRLTMPDSRTLEIAIPPGTGDGTVLRLKGQGQVGSHGGTNGDAYVEIHVEAHKFFERKELDIHLAVPVSLNEAVLGATIMVPTIDGRVALKVPRAANTGTILRLKGKGVPTPAGARGDQYVTLTVVLPDQPDKQLSDLLAKLPNYDVRRRSGLE